MFARIDRVDNLSQSERMQHVLRLLETRDHVPVAELSQTFAVWKLVVAPLTMVLLWGVLLPVARRLWQRRRFLRSRRR